MRSSVQPLDVVAIVAAIVIATVRPAPSWIETHYSAGVYPLIDRAVRAWTERVPFCVGDVLLVIALVALVAFVLARLRTPRGPRIVVASTLAMRVVASLCIVFVWFEGSWAYNYGRVPLEDKLELRVATIPARAVDALADRTIDELSRYADAAHRERSDDATTGQRLFPSFTATIGRLGANAAYEPPRVKPTIFARFLTISGSTGFTDPWTHEVNLERTISRYERPAIFAHEWAHLSGFADEAEANFIAVVSCTTARDPLLAYSGWILVWFNLPSDVRTTHRLSRRAYADLVAIRARFIREVDPGVARAQRAAYDRYLKSNRVRAGYASYGQFVRWVIAADFDPSGLPRVRPAPRAGS